MFVCALLCVEFFYNSNVSQPIIKNSFIPQSMTRRKLEFVTQSNKIILP